MSLKEFFKPTRKKIILSFLLPFVWIFLLLVLYVYNYYSYTAALKAQNAILLVLPASSVSYSVNLSAIPYLILGFIINVIYSYPLSCLVSNMTDTYKKEKLRGVLSAKNITLLLILTAIFNPIALKIISSIVSYMYFVNSYYPCGAEIVNFTQISPARDAGVSAGEVVTAVNGIEINNKSSISSIIANSEPGDQITLGINAKNYTFPMAKNPENNKPLIGILFRDKYCKK